MFTLPSIYQLAPRLRQREVSPVELTRECLERTRKLNPRLNAFITVMEDSALEQAHQAETDIARGNWRGPLHGIPMALKDIIDVSGVRTTAASALLTDNAPNADADIVRRLREAGAVIIGKNNLHEFAYGGSSLVSHFGEIHNPWNAAHITGGSSGGSAAAVAAGLCCAAIGTDTAGSIREPAALCGCVGLKPTYGRVSSRGVIPLSTSLDHVGPLTSTVADAGIVLQAIAGYDPRDITSANVPAADYVAAVQKPPSTLRVGVPEAHFYDDLDHQVACAVEDALRFLEKLVHEVKKVKLEVPTDRTLQKAESYAYHAENVSKTPELYQPETLGRIQTGAEISASDYIRNRCDLETARREISAVFSSVDLLVTPTIPTTVPAIVPLKADPDALRPAELVLLRNTRPFNVWGLPAISIPCGFASNGLPIGLQIAGPHWREDLVLQLAHAYEQATEWHKQHPQLF